jgi:hypothetical protein
MHAVGQPLPAWRSRSEVVLCEYFAQYCQPALHVLNEKAAAGPALPAAELAPYCRLQTHPTVHRHVSAQPYASQHSMREVQRMPSINARTLAIQNSTQH